MIYTLTLNPSIDQHILIKKLVKDDKIKAESIRRDPGGKGINVSRVIKELGGDTKAFGLIGGYAGHMLKSLLDHEKIEYQFCEISCETRINFILTDRSDGSQTRISSPGPRMTSPCVHRLIDTIEHIKPRPSYWAIGGSLPPGIPNDTYKKLIKYLHTKKEKCVLDTDDKALKIGLEARPFLIKPNEYELERLIGRSCKTNKDLLMAGKKLSEKAEIVAISLGKKGAIIVTQNKAWHLHSVSRVKVQSKVGAGDSFIGGFLKALADGEDLETASRWAVAAGTAAVMREGTKLCQKKDVIKLFKSVKLKKLI